MKPLNKPEIFIEKVVKICLAIVGIIAIIKIFTK